MELNKKNILNLFSSPIQITYVPGYLKELNIISKEYLNNFSSNYTKQVAGLEKDKRIQKFKDMCVFESRSFLNNCGFDLTNYNYSIIEIWTQKFSSMGISQHQTHMHSNQHACGFYFLKCSEKTSKPFFYDPRPSALMSKLPLKNQIDVNSTNDQVTILPQPGTMIIFPGYLYHGFTVDLGFEDFEFIHWNLQCISNTIKY
jgi:hypothetical protein